MPNRRIIDSKLRFEFARDLEQPICHFFKLRYPTVARCLLPVFNHSGVHLIVLRTKGIYARLPYPPSMSKTSRHCLVAVQSPIPALEEEGAPATFRRDDCVLLTDEIQICIVRIEDILFSKTAEFHARPSPRAQASHKACTQGIR
jgi:hypothetical protein